MKVVTVEPRNRGELACQQLLHTSGAESVMLLDGKTVLVYATSRNNPFTDGPQPQELVEGAPLARKARVKHLWLVVMYRPGVDEKLLGERIEKAVAFLAPLVGTSDIPPPSGNPPGSLSAVAFESVEIFRKKPS